MRRRPLHKPPMAPITPMGTSTERLPHPLSGEQNTLVVVVAPDDLHGERQALRAAAERDRHAGCAEHRPDAVEQRTTRAFDALGSLPRRAKGQQYVDVGEQV